VCVFCFQFLCGPKDLHSVKKELEAKELPVLSAEITFIPNTSIPMDAANLELVSKVMEKLDEHPDVLRVYTNIVEAS
jgi:transcriptional/translational regulatory protein YebC/TACO1